MKTLFVIQNFDKTYWGDGYPVHSLDSAKKFHTRSAAERRLNAKGLAMLGSTKAEIREVEPVISFKMRGEESPVEPQA